MCMIILQDAVHESVSAQNLTGVNDAYSACIGRYIDHSIRHHVICNGFHFYVSLLFYFIIAC